jgi:hypothetical protein
LILTLGFKNIHVKIQLLKAAGEGARPTYSTMVVLLCEYDRDLGDSDVRYYGDDMTLVLMMVVLAFGLLYVAVVAEERQMQEATKPRKR